MNHKPYRPYVGYAWIERACGWTAVAVFVIFIVMCAAAMIVERGHEADKPAVTTAAQVVEGGERNG